VRRAAVDITGASTGDEDDDNGPDAATDATEVGANMTACASEARPGVPGFRPVAVPAREAEALTVIASSAMVLSGVVDEVPDGLLPKSGSTPTRSDAMAIFC